MTRARTMRLGGLAAVIALSVAVPVSRQRRGGASSEDQAAG